MKNLEQIRAANALAYAKAGLSTRGQQQGNVLKKLPALVRAEDNENPIPNYFPAAETGSTFGFAALLNRVPSLPSTTVAGLLAQVKQWLERAVTRKGVGAKTAAGYGWFELGRKETALPSASASQSAAPTTPQEQSLLASFHVRQSGGRRSKDPPPPGPQTLLTYALETRHRSAHATVQPRCLSGHARTPRALHPRHGPLVVSHAGRNGR